MLKTLLVKPSSRSRIVSPPLGLLYLSSNLKANATDVETRLLDMRITRDAMKEYDKILREYQPDLIGISTNYGDLQVVNELATHAKAVLKKTHVCCGGPYATHAPLDFERVSSVDSLILGEGENAFCFCARRITSREKCFYPGFAPRTGSGFAIPDSNDIISDLDAQPFPDWDLIDFDCYARFPQMSGYISSRRYMTLFTSRACPYNCINCHSIFGKKVRMRSPDNVVKEIETLKYKHNVEEFQIVDDIFNFNKNRVLEICRLIEKKNLDIRLSFPNGLRGDLLDEDTILALKRAGAYSITVAFETASERLQKLIQKNIDIERVCDAVRISARNGLLTRAFFMLGFPTETLEELMSTIRLSLKLPLHAVSYFVVIPFKGTVLYDMALADVGEKIAILKHQDYLTQDAYYTLSTGLDVRRIQRIAYLKFYLNPFRLYRLFKLMPNKWMYIRQLSANLQNILNI